MKLKSDLVIHSNLSKAEYFFSTHHCQPNTPEGFVPITFYLPLWCQRRPEFPTGLIATAEDVVKLHFSNAKEIPNPDPKYKSK